MYIYCRHDYMYIYYNIVLHTECTIIYNNYCKCTLHTCTCTWLHYYIVLHTECTIIYNNYCKCTLHTCTCTWLHYYIVLHTKCTIILLYMYMYMYFIQNVYIYMYNIVLKLIWFILCWDYCLHNCIKLIIFIIIVLWAAT